MNEEIARGMAFAILAEFEQLLDAKGISIPSPDREGHEGEACLYGAEYYALEDAVVDILQRRKRTASSSTMASTPAEHNIVFALCEDDFAESFGRRPSDREEFDEWARLVEKGLRNGHIEWKMVFDCAREAMP